MNKHIITIIIPVYNTEQYLRECLDSIINQTFKDFECICINDCSTDNSSTILEEYAQKDDRFIVVKLQENKGQGNARNEGIKIARGKYITFVDSDDWVTKDYLEVLYNTIEKYNTDFVAANFYLFNNITRDNRKLYINSDIFYDILIQKEEDKKIFLKKINRAQTSTVCADIFNKDFLALHKILFDMVKFEDTLFMWKAFIRSNSFVFIKDWIYYYRINQKNSTMSTFTFDEKLKYYNQMKLVTQKEFKKYLPCFYTYSSLSCAHILESVPLKKSKGMFNMYREMFYDKDYIVDFSYAFFANKIRLFIFIFCLKYNLNYSFFGKFCIKFKHILFFVKKQDSYS